MSNMNSITLELSQPTDNKVFGSNSATSEKDNSGLFSNLLDQHKAQEQSGKSGTASGKQQQEYSSSKEKSSNNADLPAKKDTIDYKSDADKSSIAADKQSTETKSLDDTSDTESKVDNGSSQIAEKSQVEAHSQAEDNDSEQSTSQSSSAITANPETLGNKSSAEAEQLLSFLNASDKVLNNQNTSESVKTATSAEHSEKLAAITVNKNVSDIFSDKQAELKTDKTLIAQSVTQQSEETNSLAQQKIKELLNAKETAQTKATGQTTSDVEVNTDLESEGNIKTNADNKVKSTISNELDAQKVENTDKNASSESVKNIATNPSVENTKTASAVEQKTSADALAKPSDGVEENLDKAAGDIKPLVSDDKLNGKVTQPTDNKEQTAANTTNKVVSEVVEKSAKVVTDEVEAKAINSTTANAEQVLAQTKSQSAVQSQVAQSVAKADSKISEIKNTDVKGTDAKSNKEVIAQSSENTDLASDPDTSDSAKNQTKDNFINVIPKVNDKSEQNLAKSKEITQIDASNTGAEKAAQADEIAEVAMAEETSNTDTKPLNNVKPNQAINPLFDTLSAREVGRTEGEEAYIQDELSFENVMQTISADLAQTQKSAVIQQAETISIMRKDFTDAVKDKVMVMINQKIQQIDIQLDPPELGSMQVRINMQNEQAVVSFVVQNQQAKEALDQNMDRLKQMMSNSGVDVGEANVKQESNQSAMQERNEQGANRQLDGSEEGSLEQSINAEHAKVLKASSTGIDYYA